MKKLYFLIQIAIVAIVFSTSSHADGWGHHENHHRHYHEVVKYYPRPYREVVKYYPRPQPYRQVITYYPKPRVYPAPVYYPAPVIYPRPHYQSYQDPRSTQGLAGGVVGGVLGYQMGHGDPWATGLGAVAGSYIGNEMSGR